MPRVVLLGAASAYPRADSDPTSFLVEESGGALVMVDCGGSPLQRILAAALDPAKLHALCVTHTHPDHLGGFALLVHGMRMLGRGEELAVLGHARALGAARELLRIFGLDEEEGFAIRWQELPEDARGSLRLGRAAVESFPVRHSRPTLGLAITVDGSRVVYTADTGPFPELAAEARGAAVLIHEMGLAEAGDYPYHSSPAEIARVAAEARPEMVVVVHAPPLDWDAKARALAVIRARFSGRVEFGEAFGEYEFGPRGPR